MMTIAMTLSGLALLAGGCESSRQADAPIAQGPETQPRVVQPRVGVRPISQAIGRVGEAAGPRAQLLTTQTLRAPSKGPIGAAPDGGVLDAAPGEERQVRYTVREAPAADVLRVLVGELLERPYLIASGVQGQITFDLDTTMTTAEIEAFVGALASAFGWTVQDRDGVLVFSGAADLASAPEAPVIEGDAAFESDAPAVRVFRFDHISPNDARSVAAELTNKATARAVAAGQYLVVAERTEQLNRLADLFAALDRPSFEGVEIWTYRLAHVRPAEMADTLRAIGNSAGLAQESVAFIPLGATDKMMVVSRDATLQPMVRRWVSQLDEAPDEQSVQRYLYRIQHYDPAELQTVMQQLLTGRAAIGSANATPGMMRLVFAPLAKQIIVDATPAQYAELVEILSVLDLPPQQVQLQAVIAEVTLTDALEYGVEYFLSLETGEGDIELIGDALSLTASTGSAFFVASDGFALIEALDRESDVTVLSTPTVTMRDGVEATIQVGGETPIVQSVIDSGGQTGGTSDLRNEIVYRDTGITLTVEPDINESGYVTLRLVQEVSDAVSNTVSGIDSPEFTTRLLETEVVAPHGATLLLGGIVEANQTSRIDRIPILGELPLLGPLFSMNRDSVERTELIITITPTIIDDPNMASGLTSDFIKSARGVESAIAAWPEAVPAELLENVRPLDPPAEPEQPESEGDLPIEEESGPVGTGPGWRGFGFGWLADVFAVAGR
jgi:general secretion pathway protein D